MDEINDISGIQQITEASYNAPQEAEQGKDIVGMPLDQRIDLEIAGLVNANFKAAEDWRRPYREEWDIAKDHYEQIYNSTNKEDWQSTTFQPMTTTLVERATASLHNMSMGAEVPGEFKARNEAENGERVDATNEIVQHDLERSQFKVHWTDFLRNLTLYGTAIGKVNYLKEEETVMVKKRKRALFNGVFLNIQSILGFGGGQPEQEEFVPERRVVKDYASFKNCDIYTIYPQPYIEDITKDTWIIEKFKVKNKELLDGARNPDSYYRLENITPELLANGTAQLRKDSEVQGRDYAQNDTEIPMPQYDPSLEHEVMEYWGPVPKWFLEPELQGDEIAKYETVNAWIWVVDGRWVVRKKHTPFIDGVPPYVKGNYIRRSGLFWGIGIGKILQGLQIEKNEIRNTRQDNINLILNKIIAILKDKISPEDYNRLKSAPGAIWPFKNIDDVKKAMSTVDIPDITSDSWRSSAECDREAQEATDVIKTTQTIGAGEDQAGNGTFRGQMMNKQQANERFMLYARIIEIIALNSAIDKIYQRIYQFKSYEQIDKILGQKRAANFELVPPDELNEIAQFISLGALTNENKGLKLAQMRDFYLVFQAEPFMKKLEFARKMYRVGQIGSDPDEVLWSDEEMQQFNQFKREMIGSIGSAGGMTNDGVQIPGSNPIAGDVPPPNDGTAQPAMPARGPGASPLDSAGMPLS